eukprot:TRINITY_DN47199_c0_g1_i1.p2 TRINITY_DN47199_c0_g1~~TRINITY_DN47199_c0_g1_i1.p2  ORF type:complete len:293 (+),score=101.82 TRINITY_DN47199_c0_g1_i1:82-960(+)
MQSDLGPYERLLIAGTAGGCAEVCTIPVETAKVRLQLQKSGSKYTGVLQTMSTIAKEEGTMQLWKGVVAGVHRHFGCAAFRIGLYTPIRDMCTPAGHQGPPSFTTKCLASFIAGGAAMFLISPADVVKTRIQADARASGANAKPRYPSPTKAYGIIVKQEGIAGLYSGLPANMTRNAVMNIFEVGCYDQAKEMYMLHAGMKDGIPLHFASAISAAFIACVFSNPLDMVKNRWITRQGDEFKSIGDVVMKTFRNEGPLAFYKGFTPFFCRAGSFIVTQFLVLEQIVNMVRATR